MNEPTNILVFGMGRRIRDDLIPALTLIGLDKFNLYFMKKRPIKESWQKSFHVAGGFEELLFAGTFDFIFICVPPNEVAGCFELVKKLNFNGTLLIDTPITSFCEKFGRALEDQSFDIRVLEDNGLVQFAEMIRSDKFKFRIIVNWRALFDYHGISFLKSVTDERLRVRFNFKFGRFRFLLLTTSKTIVLSITPYNYSKGEIYFFDFNGGRRSFSLKTLNFYFLQCLGNHSFISKMRMESRIMKHSHKFSSNAVSQMNCWKRLALYDALSSLFFSQENVFPTIQDSLKNEIPFRP